MVRNTI